MIGIKNTNHSCLHPKNAGANAQSSKAISVGQSLIGKTKYVLGGGRSQSDINKGVFDCSSFVHYAFKQAGVNLGNMTSTTTATLVKKGTAVSKSNMQPGDLVFFNTNKKNGHVGIYLGDNKFIGAQTSTGVGIANMNDSYWKGKLSTVRRI